MALVSYIGIGCDISQILSKFTKKSDFLHFNEIWLMFQPIPMYETYDIQLHFLVRLFWYLSQWSGLICSIFCTRLYSKDIHCEMWRIEVNELNEVQIKMILSSKRKFVCLVMQVFRNGHNLLVPKLKSKPW